MSKTNPPRDRRTALIYIRVSRLERDDRERVREQGADAQLRALSPTTQIAQCRALPALRGLGVEVFEDLHRSGKNTKRPGLERLRERLHDDDVAVVACWSMSRLGRSVPDLYMLLEEMHAAGVAFVSAKESIDTSTASGRGFVGILAVLAQMERELTSERLSANWEQVARDGGLIGPVPFGYRRVDGEVTIDEPAADLVRVIFREYATGAYSYRSLAEWLNANGHRPPNFEGRHHNGRAHATVFVADALQEILGNVRYAGRVIYRPRKNRDAVAIEGQFPAIVARETWEAAGAVRRRNGAHVGRRAARVSRYALTGLGRCHRCGSTMHGSKRTKSSGSSWSYYVCRRRYGSKSCDQPLARVDELEGQMREWLQAIRLTDDFRKEFAKAIGERPAKRETRSIADRRKGAEDRLARLRELFEMGDLDRTTYTERRDRVAAEIRDLEAVPAAEPLALADARLESLVAEWDALDGGERRQVLETIFTDVEIDDGRLIAATPRAGWLRYLESVCATRGWWESNPRRPP